MRSRMAVRSFSSNASGGESEGTKSPYAGERLTHLDEAGAARMVDVSSKRETTRLATAVAFLLFSDAATYPTLVAQTLSKGDAIAVARIAAIQAAKKTSDLIPLAHPSLNITGMSVHIEPFTGRERSISSKTLRGQHEASSIVHDKGGVAIRATVKCQGKTGVEMEAITAATMGAVTLYDMLKAIDKGMVISGARVVEKQGGKSGSWVWDEQKNELVAGGEGTQQGNPMPTSGEVSTLSSPSSPIDEWNDGLAAEFSTLDSTDLKKATTVAERRRRDQNR